MNTTVMLSLKKQTYAHRWRRPFHMHRNKKKSQRQDIETGAGDSNDSDSAALR